MFTYRESFQILLIAIRIYIKLLKKMLSKHEKNILLFQLQHIDNIVHISAAKIAIKTNKEVAYMPNVIIFLKIRL